MTELMAYRQSVKDRIFHSVDRAAQGAVRTADGHPAG